MRFPPVPQLADLDLNSTGGPRDRRGDSSGGEFNRDLLLLLCVCGGGGGGERGLLLCLVHAVLPTSRALPLVS